MINWNEVFEYNAGKLYWKVSVARCVKAGAEAGSLNSGGYLQFMYQRKTYKVHRIIWCMVHGSIPEGMQIDHINGVRDDNRIDNLRLVTRVVNNRNRKQGSNNTSGVNGVSWAKRDGKWLAHITLNGMTKYLGYFATLEEAKAARLSAQAGHGFTNRHGVSYVH